MKTEWAYKLRIKGLYEAEPEATGAWKITKIDGEAFLSLQVGFPKEKDPKRRTWYTEDELYITEEFINFPPADSDDKPTNGAFIGYMSVIKG